MKNPGKAKCEVLKEIRKQIAAANDIEYSTTECKFEGECSGTCPKCEQELAYLTEEIRKRQAAGLTVDFDAFKRYQEAMKECNEASSSEVKKKQSALKVAAAAAAATLGIGLMSSCNMFRTNGEVAPRELAGIAPDPSVSDSACSNKVDSIVTDTIIYELDGDVPAPNSEPNSEVDK